MQRNVLSSLCKLWVCKMRWQCWDTVCLQFWAEFSAWDNTSVAASSIAGSCLLVVPCLTYRASKIIHTRKFFWLAFCSFRITGCQAPLHRGCPCMSILWYIVRQARCRRRADEIYAILPCSPDFLVQLLNLQWCDAHFDGTNTAQVDTNSQCHNPDNTVVTT